jgi:hypothetical protein
MLARGHTARVSETARRDRIDSLVALGIAVSVGNAMLAPRTSVYERRLFLEPPEGVVGPPRRLSGEAAAARPAASIYENRLRDASAGPPRIVVRVGDIVCYAIDDKFVGSPSRAVRTREVARIRGAGPRSSTGAQLTSA